MQDVLQIGVWIALGLTVVIVLAGVVNLLRTDPGQASRSNKLMRLRVLFQFIAILLLVGLGIVSGALF